MAPPKPELGLVVDYSDLFHARTKDIGDAGKARPCLIVAVFPDSQEPLRTGVPYLPTTHAEPGRRIPLRLSAAEGL